MDNYLSEIFDKLDKWRSFPAYQLERRADIFFAVYLKEIIESKFDKTIDLIIPEFPVRVGSIYPESAKDNRSFKIDYVAVSSNDVYLIELKTDMASRRGEQDKYLRKAKKINITNLVDGIIKIYKATDQKNKYDNLITELINLSWLKKVSKKLENTAKDYSITIVYIQPEQSECDFDIITFDDVIEITRVKNDDLSKRFTKSLSMWKINPNN